MLEFLEMANLARFQTAQLSTGFSVNLVHAVGICIPAPELARLRYGIYDESAIFYNRHLNTTWNAKSPISNLL